LSYAECLKKYYNAVDGTFYDAIKVVFLTIVGEQSNLATGTSIFTVLQFPWRKNGESILGFL
jgi:hypothetical protein